VTVRYTIGLKIFGIAVALLVLMAIATGLMVWMTRSVGAQLDFVTHTYLPAYAAIARTDVRSLERGLYLRRLMIAHLESADEAERRGLHERFEEAGRQVNAELARARVLLTGRLEGDGVFGDTVALARLDTHLEQVAQEAQSHTEASTRLLDALARGDTAAQRELLRTVDRLRDDLDQRLEAARHEMMRIASHAAEATEQRQRQVTRLSLFAMLIAGALGLGFAAAVSVGLVRPVRRLLVGTQAVQAGQLDTTIPVTSRDEIGRLTEAFNRMIGELRIKARIRDTFGKYVDPRIVEGLIDRPELMALSGERRVMTVFFCDMKGFTHLSEGLTPRGLVNLINEYLTTMSQAIREQHGIIDKYVGDAIMAFWGPPFIEDAAQARLACLAALDQLARLQIFRQALPDLMGIKRGLPEIDVRIGIATGEVVVGNIGSDLTKSYTVMGDTVNLASRLEGVNKSYGTRILVSEDTARRAEDMIETREIDTILVVGKSEPQRVYELLSQRGELSPTAVSLRERYAAGLAAYRARAWADARAALEACLALAPGDGPSRVLLQRVTHLAEHPPGPDWNGVWTLTEK